MVATRDCGALPGGGPDSASILVADGPPGSRARPSRARAWRPIRGSAALEVVARWPCEARARAAEDQLPAPALIAASSPALAGRELGRLCNPGLPGHRPAKGRNVPGNRNHSPFGRKRFQNTYGT